MLTDLAKLRWLFVIARNSASRFGVKQLTSASSAKNSVCAMSWKVVFAEPAIAFGDGSAYRRANRLPRLGVTIQPRSSEIFAVQDEITTSIAAAIAPAILDAEQQRALHKSAEHLSWIGGYHRGLWHLGLDSREHLEIARNFFKQATVLDPSFAAPYAGLARIASRMAYSFHTMSLSEAARMSERLARQALALDPALPIAYAWLGQAMSSSATLRGACSNAIKGCLSMATVPARMVSRGPPWCSPDRAEDASRFAPA